mgnify:CR=1 FL=1
MNKTKGINTLSSGVQYLKENNINNYFNPLIKFLQKTESNESKMTEENLINKKEIEELRKQIAKMNEEQLTSKAKIETLLT